MAGIYGIDLKVLVAMVTKLFTHSISAMVRNEYHAHEIFNLHTSANLKRSKAQFFSNE